jgi:hypothetical protein
MLIAPSPRCLRRLDASCANEARIANPGLRGPNAPSKQVRSRLLVAF